MNAIVNTGNLFLTVNQVAERYGVSKHSIWRWRNEGRFPAPVQVGPNCTRWRLADLIDHESTLKACCTMSLGWLDAA